ncbi:MAG TPA: hypothetical protein VFK19_06995 [Sphingomicrobium sp.]|nr:hypothetical protein [Sphingomicrobium sp.]
MGFNLQYCFAILSHWAITPVTAVLVAVALWNTDADIRLPAVGMTFISAAIGIAFYVTGTRILNGHAWQKLHRSEESPSGLLSGLNSIARRAARRFEELADQVRGVFVKNGRSFRAEGDL